MADFPFHLECTICKKTCRADNAAMRCACGGTLDLLHHDQSGVSRALFDDRRGGRVPLDRSGVWRFRELILPVDPSLVVTRGEGNTGLYRSARLEEFTGVEDLLLKHEGENPTGSFKDRGMTVAVTMARLLGMDRLACASTGNTSASMASYAAAAGMRAFVFIPSGKIAFGKLAQALAYGAVTVQIEGSFDDAMTLVERLCREEGIYLLNSLNPYRIEGQKAIGIELLSDLGWEVPDFIVLPGGNLGNSSALGKALVELHRLGLIDRLPRIAVIQAEGANPLYQAFRAGTREPRKVVAETVATAIRIGAPVSWHRCLRALDATQGIVEQVTDQEIMDAKAAVDRAGIGAEPASCATVAGIKKLVGAGVISKQASVRGILTGHLLKDPGVVVDYHLGKLAGIQAAFANAPIIAPTDEGELRRLLQS